MRPNKIKIFPVLTIIAALIMFLLQAAAGCATAGEQAAGQDGTEAGQADTGGEDAGQAAGFPEIDGSISQDEYESSQDFGGLEIFWSSDGTEIYFGLRAETAGFVAIGVQPGQRMKNADLIIGFVTDGVVTVLDTFSMGDFGPHPPDTEQGGTDDLTESSGSEKDGVTVIEFKRKLDTGDEFDNVLKAGANKIIWSYSSSDNANTRHAARGYGEIALN